MTRPALLYFASVYWDDPFITPQQIALRLARRYDLLYVEPSPSFVYLRDAGRNRRWLRVGRPPRQVAEHLFVYSPPPMLPFKTRSRWVNLVSQRWVRPFVTRAFRSLGLDAPVLFTYLPHLHAALGGYGERLVCYYCIDDMGTLSRVIDPRVVAGYERRLAARADLVFTTSAALKARFDGVHPRVYLVPNGSDPDLYARAQDPATPAASAVAGLPRPVLGFSGLVDFRLDQDLLVDVLRRRPGWSLVFVGPVRTSVTRLTALPNVRFIPSQLPGALPTFFKGFDVALIPYALGPMVRTIYPAKLNDYLGAGLPVLSTRLPELADCPEDVVTQVETPTQFIEAAGRLLAERHDPAAIARRLAFARANSWEARASVIAGHIDASLERTTRCGC